MGEPRDRPGHGQARERPTSYATAPGGHRAGGAAHLAGALATPERLRVLERLGTVGSLARETFDRSARLAARLLDVPTVQIACVEAERQRLATYMGLHHPRASERVMPLEWGFAPVVVARERPLVIGDLRHHPALANNPVVVPTRMRAFIGVPLILQGRVVGALCAVDTRPRKWSVEHLRTLGELATTAMSEIQLHLDFSESARLNEQAEATRRRSQQLQALAQASIEINSATSLKEALSTVTEKARDLIGAHQSTSSLTSGQNWAQLISANSLSDKYAAWRDFDARPTGEGIYTEVCRYNKPMRMRQDELEAHPAWRGFGPYANSHPPMRGWLAVPLIASDGHNLGLIQVSDKYEGEFTIDDEAILTQLAELASACIEKAAALDKQREIARTLQRSLLPPHLPDIPGVELAARYDPADDDSQVGGDFYDLFQARDGRWCVILGDVCGKDAEAATVTALMRHTARAAAMTDPDPAHVAELLNRAVLAHGTDRFCTLVYLTLLPEPDKAQVDLVVCGHPLPLCVDADGAVSEVGEPGMLIGVLEELSPRPTRFTMGPGDTLVLFTDGLTEARRHGPMFGETMLPALLGHAARRPVRELADIVARAALDYQGGRLKDDIATLFLRVGRDDGGGSLR
ncbi:serine phosphatase RsbU (regulator of sigma subunit) [Thermocatellispora tengchongensis]|uniref:Serine phosphatase RsbU (Regulator of sigma subunit) n=1 Tax=Thermocatellispora tengchongensis TaxID=1073253 RepID=A0A840P389_9ACTN|nr:GAF domain-containing SpoIIE family protein phosphatase [Thermocatellispora tengchongensis]MBB5133449.1 serine phosphatase RsbU (regulator of sigma subunit) [Thermocatellispora tengchongensis]